MTLWERLALIREVDNRGKDARFVADMEAEIAALRREVQRLKGTKKTEDAPC